MQFKNQSFKNQSFKSGIYTQAGIDGGQGIDLTARLPAGFTFTRASSAWVPVDAGARFKEVYADEPAFVGARLSYNHSPYVDTDSEWAGSGTTTAAVGAIYNGRLCDSATFASGASGYANRADGADVVEGTWSAGEVMGGSLELAFSRELTGSEQILIYYTGNLALAQRAFDAANQEFTAGEWFTAELTAPSIVSDVTTIFLAIFPTVALDSELTIYIRRRMATLYDGHPTPTATPSRTSVYYHATNNNALTGAGAGAPDTNSSYVELVEAPGDQIAPAELKGVLIEPEITNTFEHTDDMTDSSWLKAVSITTTALAASENIVQGAGGVEVSDDGTTGSTSFYQIVTAPAPSGWVSLEWLIDDIGPAAFDMGIFSTGWRRLVRYTVATDSAASTAGTDDYAFFSEILSSGARRVILSVNTTDAAVRGYLYPTTTSAIAADSDVKFGSFYAGYGPTSPILTGGSSVTRAAAYLRVPSSDSRFKPWGVNSGRLEIKFHPNAVGAATDVDRIIWGFNDGVELYINDAGVVILTDGTHYIYGPAITSGENTVICNWRDGLAQTWINGATYGPGAFTMSFGPDFGIGCDSTASDGQLDGSIPYINPTSAEPIVAYHLPMTHGAGPAVVTTDSDSARWLWDSAIEKYAEITTDEAGFYGARRVYNYAAYSSIDPGWSAYGAVAVLNNVTFLGESCDGVTLSPGNNGSSHKGQTTNFLNTGAPPVSTLKTGETINYAVDLAIDRDVVDNEEIRIEVVYGGDRYLQAGTAFPPNVWVRVTGTFETNASDKSSCYFYIYGWHHATPITVYWKNLQAQLITAHPIDSLTAPQAPRYFDTLNGNTLSGSGAGSPDVDESYVTLTEGAGTAIAQSKLKGILIEPERTGLSTKCNELDHGAWITQGGTINLTAQDGEITRGDQDWEVEAVSGGSNVALRQTVDARSDMLVYAIVKNDNSVECELSIFRGSPTSTWARRISFNFSTYAIVNETGDAATWQSGHTNLGNGWHFIWVAVTGDANLSDFIYYTSGRGTIASDLRTIVNRAGIVSGYTPGSPIYTDASSVVRAGTLERVASSDVQFSNWSAAMGELRCTIYPHAVAAASGEVRNIWHWGSTAYCYLDAAGVVTLTDGTNTVTGGTVTAAGSEIVVNWGGGQGWLTVDGVQTSRATFTMSIGATMGIGCHATASAASGDQLDGTMRDIIPNAGYV